MKRAAAALGALFIAGAVTVAPASALATSEGAAKFVYSVPISFTVQLQNDYAPGNPNLTTQGAGTILTSGSGTCTGTSSDTIGTYTLSFKTVTPSSAGPTACLYQQGIGFSVDSNDTNGYTVYESLDVTTAPTYYGICVGIDNGGTPSPNAPNTAGVLAAVGTFTANVLTGCATGGTLLPPAPAAVTNADTAGAAALLTAPPTGAYVASGQGALTALWTYNTIYTGGTVTDTGFFGEDVQLNVSTNAPSGTNQSHAIILYFVSS